MAALTLAPTQTPRPPHSRPLPPSVTVPPAPDPEAGRFALGWPVMALIVVVGLGLGGALLRKKR